MKKKSRVQRTRWWSREAQTAIRKSACRAKNNKWVKQSERMEQCSRVNQWDFWRWIKVAGVYGIQGEMLKSGGVAVVRWMAEICRMVWREEKAPMDWSRAIIVPLHKEDNKLKCQNY